MRSKFKSLIDIYFLIPTHLPIHPCIYIVTCM